MNLNTHSTAVKKAINIVGTMNHEDRYKIIAREREETQFNKALAMGALIRYEREQGVLEGEQKAKLDTAREMALDGVAADIIARFTHLPLETIQTILSNNLT